MDDHIALYPVIISDGSKYTEFVFLKIAEKRSYNIIGTGGGGRIKIFDHDLFFNIQRAGGIQHHTSGRIDDPYRTVHINGKSIDLVFHGIERSTVAVEIRCIGIGDLDRFFIQGFRMIFFNMIHRHIGHKSSHHNKAEEAENEISQYEF